MSQSGSVFGMVGGSKGYLRVRMACKVVLYSACKRDATQIATPITFLITAGSRALSTKR